MHTQKEILNDWYNRVVTTQKAHYLSADYFGRKKFLLGVPAVLLSTIVGTTVFATLQKRDDSLWLQITVGLASVLAAVLTSLQTFLGYSERAEKHRIAGAKYGALGRHLEWVRASESYTDQVAEDIRSRLDELAIESPNNPIFIYKRAETRTG